MHRFYKRIKRVFKYAGSNRNQFCKKHGHNYQTLQAYWNTNKLPPGNVLEDLAREYNVSLDALVMGVVVEPVAVENPVIREITRSLERLGKEDLLRVEGVLQMFEYLNSTDGGETNQTSTIVQAGTAAEGTAGDDVSDGDNEWATLEAVDDE